MIPALSSVVGLAIATTVFIITAVRRDRKGKETPFVLTLWESLDVFQVVMAYQSDKLKPLVAVATGIGLNWLHAATAILIPTKGLGLVVGGSSVMCYPCLCVLADWSGPTHAQWGSHQRNVTSLTKKETPTLTWQRVVCLGT